MGLSTVAAVTTDNLFAQFVEFLNAFLTKLSVTCQEMLTWVHVSLPRFVSSLVNRFTTASLTFCPLLRTFISLLSRNSFIAVCSINQDVVRPSCVPSCLNADWLRLSEYSWIVAHNFFYSQTRLLLAETWWIFINLRHVIFILWASANAHCATANIAGNLILAMQNGYCCRNQHSGWQHPARGPDVACERPSEELGYAQHVNFAH